VVIVVMDGLRPDSVTEADMPTLSALAARGTFFARNHSVFMSTTEVNGASLATGASPARTGITANLEYRPDVELLNPVDTQAEWAIWKGEGQPGAAKWLRMPTLIETVRASGRRAVTCGTKGVALLWDRSRDKRTVDQPTVYEGKAIPAATLDNVIPTLGPIPPGVHPRFFANRGQDHWTTRVLTEKVWADDQGELPALSVLWLSEPDYAQHGAGPGSKTAKLALKSSDDALKRVLDALAARKKLEATDVLVVSDHGFSTIAGSVDVAEELTGKGFSAAGAFLTPPEKDTVIVIGISGAVSLDVVGHDPAVIKRLVAHLQTTQWAGVIFTRDRIEGTFKHADAGIDAANAPDVIVSMRWGDAKPPEGRPAGVMLAEGARRSPGSGGHGSLSRYDMNNTLIAAGPSFKQGLKSETPSGNVDVAPTVLSILGVPPKEKPDGRVLTEALAASKETPKSEMQTMTAERKAEKEGEKPWKQYLKVSTVGGVRYYTEGNQGDAPK
ncbi:MAG TPA: alkaline phosphatase family protein, partial [Tepidisphaeraceae bacterium]|nr:alkaline phosphatase family protein [Tepidisphaeraceae bacterium]